MRPSLTIGLLWHSVRSGNLGVGAVTQAHLAMLEAACRTQGADVRFVLIGWVDHGDLSEFGEPHHSVGVRLKDFLPVSGQIWKAARTCDVVFDVGLGDSFTDIYGPKRFATQIVSKLIVAGAGTRLVLSPQTIGPFGNRVAELAARLALRSASNVFTRDRLSTDCVEQLDPTLDVVEATDLAMALPYDRSRSADEMAGEMRGEVAQAGRRVRIGVNVSGLLMAAGREGTNPFGLTLDYERFVRRSIRSMIERADVDVHLIAHVVDVANSRDDDSRWCEELAREFPEVHLAPRFRSPADAKSYIAGLDAFTGARMHGCIAAFSSGVAVLPIAYSRKFAGLFQSLGYQPLVDASVQDNRSADRTCDAFFESVDQHRREVIHAFAEAQRRLDLYTHQLQQIIAEVDETAEPHPRSRRSKGSCRAGSAKERRE